MFLHTLFGIVAAASVAASSPAPRLPDPCQRATQELEEAEDAYFRWCANHDKRYGACVEGSSPRGMALAEAVRDAKARRSQACS